MILPLRLLVGCSAAFTAMSTVVVAGITAPAPETAQHAAAPCPDSMKTPMHKTPSVEAERPA